MHTKKKNVKFNIFLDVDKISKIHQISVDITKIARSILVNFASEFSAETVNNHYQLNQTLKSKLINKQIESVNMFTSGNIRFGLFELCEMQF